MSDKPNKRDVEALGRILLRHGHAEWDAFDGRVVADAVLRSVWYAERIAEAYSEGYEAAATDSCGVPASEPDRHNPATNPNCVFAPRA